MAEEIGWLISPLLNGLAYGYLATRDPQWINRLVDWTGSWIMRGMVESGGYMGWPEVGAAGTDVENLNSFYVNSLLGEAVVLRPVMLAAVTILRDPGLGKIHGDKARSYLRLARDMFGKWERRGAWRASGDGMTSVVLPFASAPRRGAGQTVSRIEKTLTLASPTRTTRLT